MAENSARSSLFTFNCEVVALLEFKFVEFNCEFFGFFEFIFEFLVFLVCLFDLIFLFEVLAFVAFVIEFELFKALEFKSTPKLV
ncbi:hypothetical protein DMC01_03070 [Campylobacter troglodytis]|nr:hypothetical protein DMC01_03070 [Campylobacter troglodytis]